MNAKQNAEVRNPVIAGTNRPNASIRPSDKVLAELPSGKRAICNAAWDLWIPGKPSPPNSLIGKRASYAQSVVDDAEEYLRERDLWPGAAVELAIVSEVEPKAKPGPASEPDDGEWVGGLHALRILGLSETSWMTLYRHVERGHVKARPAGEGKKQRVYRRADLEAIAANPPEPNRGGRPRRLAAQAKPPTHAPAGGVPADALSAGSPPPPAGVTRWTGQPVTPADNPVLPKVREPEPIAALPPATPIDIEADAIRIVGHTLAALDEPTRYRVIRWAESRWVWPSAAHP